MLLLDHMAAPDELLERLDQAMGALIDLPQDNDVMQKFEARYSSVQAWARRGRFDKAAGVIDAMMRGLGL
jgi:predicted TIM-barrel fold metal-dependent hydrolase